MSKSQNGNTWEMSSIITLAACGLALVYIVYYCWTMPDARLPQFHTLGDLLSMFGGLLTIILLAWVAMDAVPPPRNRT